MLNFIFTRTGKLLGEALLVRGLCRRFDVLRAVRTFLYDLLTSVLPEVKPVLP